MYELLQRVDPPMHGLWVLAVGKTLKYFEHEKYGQLSKRNVRVESIFKDLTLARDIYFLCTIGSRSSASAGEGGVVARTSWVACYEFKPTVRSNTRFPDATTMYPVFTLSGKETQVSFPLLPFDAMYIYDMHVRVIQVTNPSNTGRVPNRFQGISNLGPIN